MGQEVGMTRYKILLVEDDTIVAMDSRHRLEKLGHDVVAVVRDGPSALAAVGEKAPDLVLMDIGLSGDMDGVEAASQIRRIMDIPIIYLTAHDDEATLARAKVTEPYGYLLKPSSNREIQVTVELAVYRHTMERERLALRAQIKSLEGIIPICANCKKIRDDAGYWTRVETYVSQRSGAHFSHSVCPDCMPQLYPPDQYPEIYQDDAAEGDTDALP